MTGTSSLTFGEVGEHGGHSDAGLGTRTEVLTIYTLSISTGGVRERGERVLFCLG